MGDFFLFLGGGGGGSLTPFLLRVKLGYPPNFNFLGHLEVPVLVAQGVYMVHERRVYGGTDQ